MGYRQEDEEVQILRKIEKEDDRIADDLDKVVGFLKPRLSFIKIAFTRSNIMAEGPVSLAVGQKTTASIDGFDQNGAPWTGAIPPVTFTIDNPAFATSTPNSDNVTDVVAGVSAGIANLSASLTNAAGTVLTDTETVTVVAAAPVLSSIKVNFSTPQ
jgi:hypothetical protein